MTKKNKFVFRKNKSVYKINKSVLLLTNLNKFEQIIFLKTNLLCLKEICIICIKFVLKNNKFVDKKIHLLEKKRICFLSTCICFYTDKCKIIYIKCVVDYSYCNNPTNTVEYLSILRPCRHHLRLLHYRIRQTTYPHRNG